MKNSSLHGIILILMQRAVYLYGFFEPISFQVEITESPHPSCSTGRTRRKVVP